MQQRITTLPDFFRARDPLQAAEWLLGKELFVAGAGSGMIVEAEAYGGPDDEASHSYRGKTARNAAMFEAPGTIYVYLIYGIHYCVNITCGPLEEGYAVLLRALSPIGDISRLRENRGRVLSSNELCRGPGNLCKAMGITRSKFDTEDLLSSDLIQLNEWEVPTEVLHTKRIGITKSVDKPWRVLIRNNPAVSGRRGGEESEEIKLR